MPFSISTVTSAVLSPAYSPHSGFQPFAYTVFAFAPARPRMIPNWCTAASMSSGSAMRCRKSPQSPNLRLFSARRPTM